MPTVAETAPRNAFTLSFIRPGTTPHITQSTLGTRSQQGATPVAAEHHDGAGPAAGAHPEGRRRRPRPPAPARLSPAAAAAAAPAVDLAAVCAAPAAGGAPAMAGGGGGRGGGAAAAAAAAALLPGIHHPGGSGRHLVGMQHSSHRPVRSQAKQPKACQLTKLIMEQLKSPSGKTYV